MSNIKSFGPKISAITNHNNNQTNANHQKLYEKITHGLISGHLSIRDDGFLILNSGAGENTAIDNITLNEWLKVVANNHSHDETSWFANNSSHTNQTILNYLPNLYILLTQVDYVARAYGSSIKLINAILKKHDTNNSSNDTNIADRMSYKTKNSNKIASALSLQQILENKKNV